MKKWRSIFLLLLLVGILSCSALAAESNVSTAIEGGTLKLNIAEIDTTDRSQFLSVAVIRSAAINAPTAEDIIYANTVYTDGQSSLALNIQIGNINVYNYHLIIRDKTGMIAYSQPLAVQHNSTDGNTSGKVDKPEKEMKTFDDVPNSYWAAKDIAFVTSRGLFLGTSEKTFSPEAPMTRAQLVTVLHRMAGMPAAKSVAPFKDVHQNDYYATAVAWATENGVAKGFSAETFGANNTITREQFATFMYRYAAQQGLDVTQRADLSNFTDFRSVSTYAQDAMAWANAVGLINGTGNGLLAPQAQATRSQVAAVIARFVEYQTR